MKGRLEKHAETKNSKSRTVGEGAPHQEVRDGKAVHSKNLGRGRKLIRTN